MVEQSGDHGGLGCGLGSDTKRSEIPSHLKISDGGLKMKKSITKNGGLFMVIFFCFVVSP